jgi:hypothetical protein
MMLELSHKLEKVGSRYDLVDFIRTLIDEFASQRIEWRNRAADEYLEALSAWIAESDVYYAYRGEPPLNHNLHWKQLAEMLMAATMYE